MMCNRVLKGHINTLGSCLKQETHGALSRRARASAAPLPYTFRAQCHPGMLALARKHPHSVYHCRQDLRAVNSLTPSVYAPRYGGSCCRGAAPSLHQSQGHRLHPDESRSRIQVPSFSGHRLTNNCLMPRTSSTLQQQCLNRHRPLLQRRFHADSLRGMCEAQGSSASAPSAQHPGDEPTRAGL